MAPAADKYQVRYLSQELNEGFAPQEIAKLRREDPKFDAIMAELVVIKRLLRRGAYADYSEEER
jgi:hypothetical protein